MASQKGWPNPAVCCQGRNHGASIVLLFVNHPYDLSLLQFSDRPCFATFCWRCLTISFCFLLHVDSPSIPLIPVDTVHSGFLRLSPCTVSFRPQFGVRCFPPLDTMTWKSRTGWKVTPLSVHRCHRSAYLVFRFFHITSSFLKLSWLG